MPFRSAQPGRVLLISGLLGFWVGTVGFPTWSIAVESAQAVAGLVRYPPTNPFYIYHTRIWTLIVQLSAVLLQAGVSEIALSRAISGILGMVSFQALAMFVYALSADASLSIGAAFLVFISRITDFGAVYPVMLLDTHHTYGALGLSFVVLATTLVGNGYLRTGALLIGVGPAVHPSLGFWYAVVAAICVAPDLTRRWNEFRPAMKWLAIGMLVAAVSLAVQLTLIAHRVPVDSGVAAGYFSAFVAFYDEHRKAVHVTQPGVLLNWGALGIALIALKTLADDAPYASRLLLRTVVVSAVVGLVAACFTWLPAARQPMLLSMFMPARVLNYNIMMVVPLLIGVLGRPQRGLLSLATLSALLGALLLNARGPLPIAFLDPWLVLEAGVAATAVVLVVRAVRPEGESSGSGARYALSTVCLAMVIAASLVTLSQVRPSSYYRDRTNDPLFAQMASEKEGLLLTAGSYQLVQLYTRRPVLLDGGGLDTITYAPDTGPAMRRILHDVYEVDYFDPPGWMRGTSLMPHNEVRRVWESFSPQKWRDIRRTYDVRQILVNTSYNLQLPIAAEEGAFRLYRIPDDQGATAMTTAPFSVVEATIPEMQAAMAEKRVTSRQLVEQYLARIHKYNDTLNAVMALNPHALEEADARDRERLGGAVRGPLHGIPVALKDNIQVAGMPTTGGALAFKNFVPPYEATLARNLRDAGAIVIAKTTMTELANWVAAGMPNNYNALVGYAMNPYDPRRDPRSGRNDGRPVLNTGGSSSGAGTAVSFWAASVGTETSGSILSPANQNMLAAIKPTVGRVSRYGVIPITADQDTPGPMARTVADAALLLGALEGAADSHDPATAACARVPGNDYTKFLDSGALKGARIGVPRRVFYADLSPDEARLMGEAIDVIRKLGATVVDPADIPSVTSADPSTSFSNWGICAGPEGAKGKDADCSVVLKYGMKRDFNAWLASLGPSAPVRSLTALREWNLAHRGGGAMKYGQAELDISDEMDVERDRVRYETDRARDLRLAATGGIDAAMKSGRLDALLFPSLSGYNIAARPGYPTVIVPVGFVPNAPEGVPFPPGFTPLPSPFGVSFTGLACSEPRLIGLAYAFEQATRRRVPPPQFP